MGKSFVNLSKLLHQAAKGDRQSFGEFYELHLNEIYRYIFFRVGDHHEAEDLTEKVFLDAWENLISAGKGKKIEYARAWIYKIARNKVIDYYRTRIPQVSIEDNRHEKLQSDWLESDVGDVFVNQELVAAIRKLPEDQQQVIVLRFINQLSHADVAEILNIKEGYARVLQYRALKRLRDIMTKAEDL